MKGKILVVDKMHDSIIPMLNSIGWEADYHPNFQRTEILERIGSYQGLIIRSKTKIDEEFVRNTSSLKFVARAGAGIDNLDTDLLKAHKIQVVNAAEGNRDALGEHCIGMILSVLHRIHVSNREVRGDIWRREENRGHELGNKTVGILGFGHMGSALAERLISFGCKVVAYDKYKTNYAPANVEELDLETFKNETEILSLHVPLTEETKAFIDYDFLTSFPRLFILVNTARGEILKTNDLLKLFEEGKLYGAAFDVLENEKLASLNPEEKEVFNQLKSKENIVFSPHVAGWTFESYRKINEVLVEKISKLNF